MRNEASFSPCPSNSTKDWRKDLIFAPLLLGVILIIGHYGLFAGETFFVDPDATINFDHNEQNKLSEGWRPDVALGLTYFFGDPGLNHTWNLSRLWAEMFENDRLAYQVQVLVLIWVACLVQYFFIRKVVPEMGRVMAILLSSLIAFSSLRYEFLFLRSNILQVPATCLLSVVLWDFLKQPKMRHYFFYTAIMFFLAFLGSSVSLFQILVFVGIFCIGIAVYNKWHFLSKELWIALKRFFVLNITAGFSLIILGAWIFYGILWEQLMLGYVRDPYHGADRLFLWPGIEQAAAHFFNYFNAGLFSPASSQLGLEQKFPVGHSWNNYSPLFPFILLVFIVHKSRCFWEYISKFVILTSFAIHEILFWIPGFLTLTQALSGIFPLLQFYTPGKLHPCIQVFEILMTGFLMARYRGSISSWRGWTVTLARIVAGLLTPLYFGLFVVVSFTSMVPDWTERLASKAVGFLSFMTDSDEALNFLSMVAVENVRLFHETMGGGSILFYGTTAILLAVLAGPHWRRLLTYKGGFVFLAFLFVNNLLLSWAVYPLAKQPFVWDKMQLKGKPAADIFGPTDRLVRVGTPRCLGDNDYFGCIRRKFFDAEYGARRYIFGHRLKQALDFGKVRNFTPLPTSDFITSFMVLEKINTLGILRTLQIEPPIINSRMYDLAAVNYLLSRNPLPKGEHLELAYENKQLYLYRNKRAWPYYYLADRIETIEAYKDLYNAERGTAYLWENDEKISISSQSMGNKRSLKLVKFEYGDVEFRYSSDEQGFLVMADSWHPNWRASVNGQDTPIIKTNGVFKGVLLPPGNGVVHFFFDNSPYLPGIWISVFAWSLFLFGWGWCAFRLRERY